MERSNWEQYAPVPSNTTAQKEAPLFVLNQIVVKCTVSHYFYKLFYVIIIHKYNSYSHTGKKKQDRT